LHRARCSTRARVCARVIDALALVAHTMRIFSLTPFAGCHTWRNAIGEIAPAGIRRAGFCFAARRLRREFPPVTGGLRRFAMSPPLRNDRDRRAHRP
jgi:hypothetical protein